MPGSEQNQMETLEFNFIETFTQVEKWIWNQSECNISLLAITRSKQKRLNYLSLKVAGVKSRIIWFPMWAELKTTQAHMILPICTSFCRLFDQLE